MAWSGSKWKAVVRDFLERAGWSAGQVFFATLLAGGSTASVADLPWKYAITIAISAAVSSVILTALQYLAGLTAQSFGRDLLIRVVKTFLGSLAASIVTSGVFDITRFHWSTALNVAVLAALAAFGKGLLAREPARSAAAGTKPAAAGTEAPAGAKPVPESSPSTLPLDVYLHAEKK
jgi:hypothetical protein